MRLLALENIDLSFEFNARLGSVGEETRDSSFPYLLIIHLSIGRILRLDVQVLELLQVFHLINHHYIVKILGFRLLQQMN